MDWPMILNKFVTRNIDNMVMMAKLTSLDEIVQVITTPNVTVSVTVSMCDMANVVRIEKMEMEMVMLSDRTMSMVRIMISIWNTNSDKNRTMFRSNPTATGPVLATITHTRSDR